jgi:subtilisin family serine protease
MSMDAQDTPSLYYYNNGKRVPLIVETGGYAVKFRTGVRADSATLSEDSKRILRDESTDTDFISNYGVFLYRSKDGDDPIPRLRRDQSIVLATPLVRTPGNPNSIVINNQLAVQFKDDIDQDQIDLACTRYGVEVVEKLGFADNAVVLRVGQASGMDSLAVANALQESGLTRFAHPDFITRRHVRLMPATGAAPVSEGAAYLSQEWHLVTAQVLKAWELPGLANPQGSPDITIAILDDGIDVTHQEFSGSVGGGSVPKIRAQYDFATQTADGSPKTAEDNHGTACAGVATAAGLKVYGAAPGCRLIAGRAPDYLGVVDEARMFEWAATSGADVISCSWGGPDGIGAVQLLSDTTRAAIHFCVTSGRAGKGIPIVWAAGNGNESLEKNGQPRDGYACNPEVMAIGASTSGEVRAWYSDFGPELWVCAPSSGDRNAGEKAIFTVDRAGAAGYNPGAADKGDADGNYTNDFGGTSSAAPLVAGVIGLMLSVNPQLTCDEVRQIVKTTADKIRGGYDANGHSDTFGYGRLNAYKAVQAANAGSSPSIVGPQQLSRSAGPPTFQVDPGPNQYYAVEVATEAELLDSVNHTVDRTANTFYASWQDSGFFSAASYTLPSAVWARLRGASQLYYRLCTTASSTGWVNTAASTPSSRAQDAPVIQFTNGAPADPVTRRVVRADTGAARSGPVPAVPTISGPVTFDRASTSAPGFLIVPGANGFFGVEVAGHPDLFAPSNAAKRTSDIFFASWREGLIPAPGSTTYWLPDPAWRALLQNERLYYRVVTAAANVSTWPNFQTSLPSDQLTAAPYIQLEGRSGTRGAGAPTRSDEDLWRRKPTGGG